MPVILLKGNVVDMDVDAVVNAANTSLTRCQGVCNAIFEAAGAEKLTEVCAKLGRCKPGYAVITPGFNLKARYIIHTAGPEWYSAMKNERFLLDSCYRRSLELAYACGCKSIAFPLIFSGDFHIPRRVALEIAKYSIGRFLHYHPQMKVYMVLYNDRIFQMAQGVFGDAAVCAPQGGKSKAENGQGAAAGEESRNAPERAGNGETCRERSGVWNPAERAAGARAGGIRPQAGAETAGPGTDSGSQRQNGGPQEPGAGNGGRAERGASHHGRDGREHTGAFGGLRHPGDVSAGTEGKRDKKKSHSWLRPKRYWER